MNEASQDERPSLGLARAQSQAVRAVTVDCGDWDTALPASSWSSGRLRSAATRSQPAVAGPLLAPGALQLEIAIHIEPEIRPADAFSLAARLVGAVAHELGNALIVDMTRSRAEDNRAVIALTVEGPEPNARE